MKVAEQRFCRNGLPYLIRSARQEDAAELSQLRLQMDSETENLDREPGEGFIDASGFEQLIRSDTESDRNLFLVAIADGRIVGFSRCEGNELKRFAHKAEFGIGVLKAYWGNGIGKNLLSESIKWADESGLAKLTLNVLETNEPAIRLYEELGFQAEGVLVNDKTLSDGKFYNTVVMGRLR
ncbi:GNAT family N-acetyltransferase [Planococcus lenghuensis]|uniref:GNAT family N-acetyltransferase n=1 Tax=Planococcus lenghuensis TaxID=2213202 RepID=A0A1Q2L296_9BACL|nr:GNAT family N-acetyltransferase [Planococcus lenghuensis]AQQ54578.1 GNAT family N-acetyltransferase [Planococcus lenghuensis]